MGQAQCHRVGTEIRTGQEKLALRSLRQEDVQVEVLLHGKTCLRSTTTTKTSTMGQECGRGQNMWSGKAWAYLQPQGLGFPTKSAEKGTEVSAHPLPATHKAIAHDAVEAFEGLQVLVGEVELNHS